MLKCHCENELAKASTDHPTIVGAKSLTELIRVKTCHYLIAKVGVTEGLSVVMQHSQKPSCYCTIFDSGFIAEDG